MAEFVEQSIKEAEDQLAATELLIHDSIETLNIRTNEKCDEWPEVLKATVLWSWAEIKSAVEATLDGSDSTNFAKRFVAHCHSQRPAIRLSTYERRLVPEEGERFSQFPIKEFLLLAYLVAEVDPGGTGTEAGNFSRILNAHRNGQRVPASSTTEEQPDVPAWLEAQHIEDDEIVQSLASLLPTTPSPQ